MQACRSSANRLDGLAGFSIGRLTSWSRTQFWLGSRTTPNPGKKGEGLHAAPPWKWRKSSLNFLQSSRNPTVISDYASKWDVFSPNMWMQISERLDAYFYPDPLIRGYANCCKPAGPIRKLCLWYLSNFQPYQLATLPICNIKRRLQILAKTGSVFTSPWIVANTARMFLFAIFQKNSFHGNVTPPKSVYLQCNSRKQKTLSRNFSSEMVDEILKT